MDTQQQEGRELEVRESNEQTIRSTGRRATTGGREIALRGGSATRGAKKNFCMRNEQQNHEVPKKMESAFLVFPP